MTHTIHAPTMILSNHLSAYDVNEIAVVIVAALAFVLALGGITLAAIAICGWNRVESVNADWMHGKVSFVCRR